MGRAAINVRVAPVVMLVSNLVHSQNTQIATVYGYDRIVPKETGDKVRAGVNHPRWNLTHGASKTGTTCIVSLTLLVKGNPAIHLLHWGLV